MGSNTKKEKGKIVKQPPMQAESKWISQGGDPDSFYRKYPSWIFHNSDPNRWQFDERHVGDCFWQELFPYLRNIETQTWSEILIVAKKQNHSIPPAELNKAAQTRLEEMYVEAEAIYSLRVTATHRIYGYMSGSAFNILWYDSDHGDNDTCVCRSRKKHT